MSLPPEGEQDEFFWLKAVRCCPKALLDLVNSKACRGKRSPITNYHTYLRTLRHRCYHVQRLAICASVRETGKAALRDSLPIPVCARSVCLSYSHFNQIRVYSPRPISVLSRPSLVPLLEIGAVQADVHNKRNRRRNDWSRLETITD
jgi:hypothetical protein